MTSSPEPAGASADTAAVEVAPSAEAHLVLDRCDELAALSSNPDFLERVHLSPEHRAANDLVASWMLDAGLTTWQDAAGNQCGRIEGREPGLPALVLGSHIDTVPDAGRYDGMLGVVLAIATAKRLVPRASELPFALEVVAFSDEEGTRFGTALLGSRAFAGTWDEKFWQLTDQNGISLFDAFVDFGLDPARLPGAARPPESLFGYLEAHIEQGPILEDARHQLAVVTSIAGARRFALTMHGKAGHAGGTPFDRRRDALVGASELVIEIERLSRRHHVIGTVGQLQAYPGGVNVIPGRVEFSLDLRAEYDEDRDVVFRLIQDAAHAIASGRGLRFEQREIYRADAAISDKELRAALEEGIRSTGDPVPLAFWSRAGHDAMAVASATRFAMLFLRNGNGGVSHHPDETVRGDDVDAALNAYERAVISLAS
jgi:allantoate deiminase